MRALSKYPGYWPYACGNEQCYGEIFREADASGDRVGLPFRLYLDMQGNPWGETPDGKLRQVSWPVTCVACEERDVEEA